MNKSLFLVFFIAFSSFMLEAQPNIQKHTVRVADVKSTIANNHTLDGIKITGEIPIHTNASVHEVKLTIISSEEAETETVTHLIDKNNITSDYIFDWQLSTERKKKLLRYWITPIKINNNQIELLSHADVTFTVDQRLGQKNTTNIYQNESLLNTGDWYKIKVNQTGVFKLSYDDLQNIGLNDPKNVRVFSYGGRQLPYQNSEENYDDLNEISIEMTTGSDGIFNAGDYIIFYAEGPQSWDYNDELSMYLNTHHLYSDYIYLFLSSDHGVSKKIEKIDNSNLTENETTDSYDFYTCHELDKYNLIGSGRTWYGEKFSPGQNQKFEFELPNLISSSNVKIRTSVAGRREPSSNLSYFRFSQNGQNLGNINISSTYGDYTYAYAYDYTFETLINSENVSIDVSYWGGNSSSEGYLDYLCLNARSKIELNNGQLAFRDKLTHGVGNITKFNISSSASDISVWDITNSEKPMAIETTKSGNSFSFKQESSILREFIAFTGSSYLTPIISGDDLGKVENQNLHGVDFHDMLIISHPNFLNYAEQLAEIHRQNDDLSVFITTPQLIYNEFSGGTPDVSALRNFVRMLYDRSTDESEMPKYLLLFGDGSYDNRSTTNNSNFIPTYQSETSLSETASFVSDDFYGLLDADEGGSSGALDIGIGRFPVRSNAEAEVMIDKVIRYINNDSKGDWRTKICFIADDGDGSQHMKQPDEIARSINLYHPEYNIQKIYLDAFEQVSTPAGQRCPDATTAINEQMSQGALIVDYVGHGNPRIITHEQILSVNDVKQWKNTNQLPIFVTASCEVGRFDNYDETSFGEWIVLNPDGGGIAALTTTRVVYSHGNHQLNTNFFNVVFNKDLRLGDIIRLAKVNTPGETNKRNFSLLGDPALKLAVPEHTNYISQINGKTPQVEPSEKTAAQIALDSRIATDTLKALEKATISGYVLDTDENIVFENGELDIIVFDKARTLTTIGDEVSSTINFDLQNSVIYKGKASINEGFFEVDFITPKDINYSFGKGKISLYAKLGNTDAIGYSDDIMIGGNNENAAPDYEGPEIELFINDTNFVNYGTTGENPILLAHLKDETGINTTGNGFGHNITATLDQNENSVFVLNNFYTGELDMYNQGSIAYPLYNLTPGEHEITLKVWDIHNNSSTAQIHFIVHSESEIILENIKNSPNPFNEYTTFYFEHNQAFQPTTIHVNIYDIYGNKVTEIEEQTYQTGNLSNTINWDGRGLNGAQLSNGMYIYTLEMKLEDGTKTTKTSKMMIFR